MGAAGLAAGALAPPPLYPVIGAIYFGTFVAVLYREKQAKQQRLTEDEKEIAAKEFFAQKVTYEWNTGFYFKINSRFKNAIYEAISSCKRNSQI
uniref:Uncharacterized protein n=1 Tax=Panagrolaimus sp. PS1159 TaxID=55785 RepID=A0AC35FIJ1_9BILA